MNLLTDFFESDLQTSEDLEHYLANARSVNSGKNKILEMTGNAYHDIFKKDFVTVEFLWDDEQEPKRIATDRFIDQLILLNRQKFMDV